MFSRHGVARSYSHLCIRMPRETFNHKARFASLAELMAATSSKNASEAKFSHTLAEQVESFNRCGYVLIRMAPNEQYNSSLVEEVSTNITKVFMQTENSVFYQWWRWFNSVNSPNKRHAFRLPMTVALRSLLNGCISSLRPFLDTQLPNPKSPLVELNAVLSQPGAGAQAVHSDILFPRSDTTSDQTLILTAMMALNNITLDMGPTFMFSGSHTKAFHAKYRRHIKGNADSHYDSYGDLVEDYSTIAGTGAHVESECEGEDQGEGEGMHKPVPVYAALQQGDVLLFDTKLFHYGGQNISHQNRQLLSWSFQKPVHAAFTKEGDEMTSEPIYGFTYHLEDSIKKLGLTLQDFTLTLSLPLPLPLPSQTATTTVL